MGSRAYGPAPPYFGNVNSGYLLADGLPRLRGRLGRTTPPSIHRCPRTCASSAGNSSVCPLASAALPRSCTRNGSQVPGGTSIGRHTATRRTYRGKRYLLILHTSRYG